MSGPAPALIDSLPLPELLAFEATARLGSIARAAEELSVTGSALSHRLAGLQARLGVPLFERKGKGLRITAEGERFLQRIQAGLHEFAARGEALRAAEHELVRLVAAPALAAAWLLPRLAALQAAQPGLRLDVTTLALADDAAGQDWDVLVHYGPPTAEGGQRVALAADAIFPVCAPALLPGGRPLQSLAQLRALPLLRHTLLSWSRWTEAAFGAAAELQAQAYFDDATAMLEAAAAGAGVALTAGIAAGPYLADGRLVAAHACRLPDQAFFAELSEGGLLKPRARAVLAWLADQAAGSWQTTHSLLPSVSRR